MKRLALVVAAMLAGFGLNAEEMMVLSRERMIRYTPRNPFDRFPDGRPKVPDALLERARALSLEDVFAVLRTHGFRNQYEGGWQILHPERKLVGRAVTAQYLPYRPDVFAVAEGPEEAARDAKAGFTGHGNGYRRMVDVLQNGDVLVVDVFGNTEAGGPVGDNLATAIYAATNNGFVMDGAVRDVPGISEIPETIFFRAPHPAAINNVMLSGINVPIRIGHATVMPGDVVLGDREGIYFIPPQFIEQIVTAAETTRLHDEWTKAKFMTRKYKASDLYPSPSDPKLLKEYQDYLKERLGKPAPPR